MIHDEARLRQVLGGPSMAWLRKRLRARLEDGRPLPKTVSNSDATPSECEALAAVLGRASSAPLRVDVERFQERLRTAEICDDLIEAIVALDGPLIDRAARRAESSAQWATLDARMHADPREWVQRWYEALRSDGTLRRFAEGEAERAVELVDKALRLGRLFHAGGTALPAIAADVCGDAHALDKGRPLGTLGVRLAAAFGEVPSWRGADEWREAWASAGVLEDQLSQPVLSLGLTSEGDGLSDRMLALHQAEGEVCSLTLRHLVRHPPRWGESCPPVVFVCENPAIVAAAVRRLGRRCAPLVCSSGFARAATRVLLRALSRAGAELHVRADFDASGLHIASKALELPGARPWRLDVATFRAGTPGPPLVATPPVPETPWDPPLRQAILDAGHSVHEESLLEILLSDLET